MSEKNVPQSRELQVLDIMENFNFAPKVSNKALESYCQRKGFEFLPEGEYQDHIFQYQHDQRMVQIIPIIVGILAKYQFVPDYAGESKKKEIREHNDMLEFEIAEALEDNGIVYREVDTATKNLAAALGSLIENAGTRANNMCAQVISTVAVEKFGHDLKLSDLAEFHRSKTGASKGLPEKAK